jgi:hypothetical protein
MKKRIPGKSVLEASALGFGPADRNHWKSSTALCLLAASLFTSASAQVENNNSSNPEQVTTTAVTKKNRQHLARCLTRLGAVEAKGDNAWLRPNAENSQCDDADPDSLPA